MRRRSDHLLACFCLLALLIRPTLAENLWRNASFETWQQDVVMTGYNRYNPLRNAVTTALATEPVEVVVVDELADVLGEEFTNGSREKRGWRLVELGAERAWHGKRVLACELGGASVGFGFETEGGWYTLSLYARSSGTDVLQLRLQDIRGRKGEIRNEQRKAFRVEGEWTHCVTTVNLERGPVTIFLEMMGDGDLKVDAIQFEAGKEATAFALHPWDQQPPAQLACKDEQLYPSQVQRVDVAYVEDVLSGIAEVPEAVRQQPGEAGSLPLHTWFPAGSPEGDLPATGGVPLPRGKVFSIDHMRIIDADGEPVPAQFKVLSRHVADGSIQMVLIDIRSPLALGASLRFGPQVQPVPVDSPLSLVDDDTSLTIDTGQLRLVVRRDSGRLLDELWYAGEQLLDPKRSAGPFVQDPTGRLYWGSLSEATKVVVEERGPLRVSVLFSGTHRSPQGHDLFTYEVRLHAYAGQALLRLEHTFINAQQPYASTMTGMGLRLGLRQEWLQWAGWPEHAHEALAPATSLQLIHGVGRRQRTGDTLMEEEADLAPGWITVGNTQSALTATIREWSDQPPKEVVVTPAEGLDLCLWPRHLTAGFVAPVGLARSHRVWLQLHPADQTPQQAAAWHAYFSDDARVETAPEIFCDSTVFGKLAIFDNARFPGFETFVQRDEFGHFPLPGEYRWSGNFIHHGDDRGDMGFGNMETMLVHCMWLLYARSLDPWYFRRARDGALHYRDVDMCHPWGQARVHSHNHTHTPWDFSHAWIKGTLEHYLLTGDTRSLQVAHQHGRWIRSIPIEYKVSTGSRRWTRCVQNLVDLYRITGQRAYYDNVVARLDVADQLRGDHTEVSRFALQHLAEGCTSYGRFDMQQYYGVAGLEELDKATNEPRWRLAFLDEMRFLLAASQAHKAITTEDAAKDWGRQKGLGTSSARDRLIYTLLSHAHTLTGEERFRQAAIHSAFLETTRTDWKNGYPSLIWAGNVLAAYGVQLAVDQGLGTDFETSLCGEALEAGLPGELRDPEFERESPTGWGSGRDLSTARTAYNMDIAMDTQTVHGGERALTITEPGLIAATRQLDYDKRQLPMSLLDRNLLHLTEPGVYELSGYVRFKGHGRPNVQMIIDDLTTHERRTIDLALPALLPRVVYDDILGVDGKQPEMGADQKPELEGVGDLATVLAEGEQVDPETQWYRFQHNFALAHAASVRVILHYHFGLKPPGQIWFDDFRLAPTQDEPTPMTKVALDLQSQASDLQ